MAGFFTSFDLDMGVVFITLDLDCEVIVLFIGDELFNGLGVPTKARPRRSVGLGDKALDGLFEPFMGVIGGFGPPNEPREASPRRRRGFPMFGVAGVASVPSARNGP